MKIGDIKARIEERMNDSKRDKIRATYALEILNDYESLYHRDDSYNLNHENLKQLLCGAKDWRQYSEGGCSLVYNGDIEERIGKGGDLIERQADYLRQAYNMIANYATEDELDYNWLPSVMMI